ncbi:CoA transferase, partial [Burkholderia vietnamiensis]|uniref:CoA transferase n=1 Tax=Burkholderia vietnamiensis TaxID=60552 RepID=UPI001CC53C46
MSLHSSFVARRGGNLRAVRDDDPPRARMPAALATWLAWHDFPDLHSCGIGGVTPLMLAALQGEDGVLDALLADADVLVQNLAPGATERLGLGYDALKHTHPRLIVCDISGYGGDGPYRDRKAYDLLIQSEAGFLSITGSA